MAVINMRLPELEENNGPVQLTDNAPYLYRQAPIITEKLSDKLIGGTYSFNQLLTNGDFSDGVIGWAVSSGASFSVTNKVATFRASAAYQSISRSYQTTLAHKYIMIGRVKSYTNTNTVFRLRSVQSGSVVEVASATMDTAERWYGVILNHPVGATSVQVNIQDNNNNSWGDITLKNIQMFDLTQMFGATIADYIYSLETATPGAGVAWFRALFSADYYAYNAGELISVKTSAHKTVGKNLCTVAGVNNVVIARVKKGETYTFSIRNKGACGFNLKKRNNNGVVVAAQVEGVSPLMYVTFTADEDFDLFLNGYGTNGYTFLGSAYDYQLEISTTATNYEPYEENVYPLDNDLELRGIPKLDASNNLYYDGDTYESNGTVTKKYYQVTLNGTETWGQASISSASTALGLIRLYTSLTNYPATKLNSQTLSSQLPAYTGSSWTVNVQSSLRVEVNRRYEVAVFASNFADANAWRTHLQSNPITVLIEADEPTTETADPFTDPQDAGYTEQYIDERAVPVPVGHETKYFDMEYDFVIPMALPMYDENGAVIVPMAIPYDTSNE